MKEKGFTLVELLVAGLILLVVLGVTLMIYDQMQNVSETEHQRAEMQQNARALMEVITRDLLNAGYGLGERTTLTDAIQPNTCPDADTFTTNTITLRGNLADTMGRLATDMSASTDDIVVALSAGFSAGDYGFIYDSTGSSDYFFVDDVTVTVDGLELEHSPIACTNAALSKAYATANDTIVSRVNQVTYQWDLFAEEVTRRENDQPAEPLGYNIEELKFDYYDDTEPPEVFSPASYADRLRIRGVGISLTARSQHKNMKKGDYERLTLASEVFPRNLPLGD